jgi:hypothetical protein
MAAWDNDPVVGDNAWDNDPVVEALPPAPPQPVNTLGQAAARQAGYGLTDKPGYVEQFAGGAKHAWDRAAAGLQSAAGSVGLPTGESLQPLVKQGGEFVRETGPASSVGQFAGDVALTAPIAATLPAALLPQIVGNAAWNATISPDNRGTAAALGGVGGAAGHMLSKAVGALKPTAEAEKLLAKNVPLTYGQRLGPPVQSLENTLARVPYVGAPIRARQQEALAGWQQATRNEAAPGMATIDDVYGTLSKQYETLVGQTKFDHMPNVTVDALVESASKTPGSTPSMLKTLGRELEDLKSQFTDASPATFHKVESTLKQLAFKFKSSPNPEQKIYGEMLADAAGGLRESWRSALPPTTQDALAKVDAAYANFVPIRSASTKYVQTLDNPENYTPRMLQQALRQKDTTLGKSQFRETPQGALAQAGEAAIGSRSNAPNTGSGIGSLILGGGASVLGHTPAAIGAAGAGAAYGTKAGQKLMIGSLPLQRAIVDALRRGAPAVSLQGSRQDEQPK